MDADFVAVKNTLMIRALSEYNLSDEDKKNFEQPTATLFIYGDIVEPLKNLAKTSKELGLPTVKFGILDKKQFLPTRSYYWLPFQHYRRCVPSYWV